MLMLLLILKAFIYMIVCHPDKKKKDLLEVTLDGLRIFFNLQQPFWEQRNMNLFQNLVQDK